MDEEDDPYMAHLDMMEELINSKNLSLDAWKHMIDTIPGSFTVSVDIPHCLNRLLLEYKQSNKELLFEIVEWMLSAYPGVASLYYEDDMLPLHVACFNINCPSSIVELLAKNYPEALGKMCIVSIPRNPPSACNNGVIRQTYETNGESDGLPICYYLIRDCDDVNLSTVKLLVELYPQALTTECDHRFHHRGYYPIHAVLCSPKINDRKDILEYILECEPTSIRLEDDSNRTPLNLACSAAVNVDIEVVKLLVNAWPEGAQRPDNGSEFSDRGPYLPIHNLCNNSCFDDISSMGILQLLIGAHPSSPKESDSSESCLPIHLAAGSGDKSMMFCKMLVEAYPESLRIESDHGRLPIHEACIYGNAIFYR